MLGMRLLWSVLGGVSAYTLIENERQQSPKLRPPGAKPEKEFLGTCTRCGRCQRDCPFKAILMDTGLAGVAAGTPNIVARDNPCRLCGDFPCIKACPSGALQPVADFKAVRMGTAAINEHTCLSWKGMRCEICYRKCPLIDKAIFLEIFHNEQTGYHAEFRPHVDPAYCVGCGICENACPVAKSAIEVRPSRGDD